MYPILIRIPPQERVAWVTQAESGIELTDEQHAQLGSHPAMRGGVLIPTDTRCATKAQVDFVFPPMSRGALYETLARGLKEVHAQATP
jgi:hypothetical protein